MERIIGFLRAHESLVLDVTGGCPELNPHFKFLLESAHPLVSRLMVRTNLSVLTQEGMEWIPEWYSNHKVVVIGSLPCYTESNVDGQRGEGVFHKSIRSLKKLNALGYGTLRELNLVYNPGGDSLPPPQEHLEREYREKLLKTYGIRFTNLFTITNAPLGRFRDYLASTGRGEAYLHLLASHFNPEAARRIMCRTGINVDWQGTLFNCDFNQAAGLPLRSEGGTALKIEDIDSALGRGLKITTADHCYSCTAGAGSSCTGALVQ
jgi:radical SAM/Cys-rich protein